MNKTIPNITDYDIQALIDNELEHEKAKEVHMAISTDSNFLDRYNELLHQKHLLKQWWKSKHQ